jgi:hypothetical protein
VNRKSFIKTGLLGLGAVIQIPFTGERIAASEIHQVFSSEARSDTVYDVIIIGGSYAGGALPQIGIDD